MAIDRERGTGGAGSLALFVLVAAALWAAAALVALTIALFFVFEATAVTAALAGAAGVAMLVGLGFATRLLAWAMEAPKAGTAVAVIAIGVHAVTYDGLPTLPDLLVIGGLAAAVGAGWWLAGRRMSSSPATSPVRAPAEV